MISKLFRCAIIQKYIDKVSFASGLRYHTFNPDSTCGDQEGEIKWVKLFTIPVEKMHAPAANSEQYGDLLLRSGQLRT